MITLGLLALASTGCPRSPYSLGKDGGAADGGDAPSCGRRGLPDCEADEYCRFSQRASCGDDGAAGSCQPRPEFCTEQYDPVCGCDGETYGNACAAASSGVSIRSDGECEQSGRACGGLMGGSCPDDQFCDYAPEAICGAADATGICTDKPEACDDIYQPVCGCDGKTYANACEAASTGTSITKEGACSLAEGDSCSGSASGECPDDTYCRFAELGQCGAADESGVCTAKPDACTREFKPVCGCDGMTYNTACLAGSAGVNVASEGECGAVCGVRGAAPCSDDEYCAFPLEAQCGAADQPGMCKPRPDACTQQFSEVCGCDGVSYGNECVAATSGTAVAHEGTCESTGSGQICGGFAGVGCPDDEYCDFDPATRCGSGDQAGLCALPPSVCTKDLRPVCGCDGVTYDNACLAASAATSVVSEGACGNPGSGQTCGGLMDPGCPGDEFCDFPAEAQCGAADGTGSCRARPENCTAQYDPVCGCDGVTYGNACEAARVAVSIVSTGECAAPGSGQVCGGLMGPGCPDDEFCDFPAEAQCGAADGPGSCHARPENCTQQFDPVCGCDGITYGNACGAASAGISLVSAGECAPAGSGQTCGGLTGAMCPDQEFCEFSEAAQCGAADQTGTCRTRPQNCTQQSEPVCGCDDVSYGNRCEAAAAGTSVVRAGNC